MVPPYLSFQISCSYNPLNSTASSQIDICGPSHSMNSSNVSPTSNIKHFYNYTYVAIIIFYSPRRVVRGLGTLRFSASKFYVAVYIA